MMDRFHVAKKPGAVVDRVRKKGHVRTKRACLRKTQRPSTSQMWALRKCPQDLSDEGQIKLLQLFERIPDLELPAHFLWRRTDIMPVTSSVRKLPANSKNCVGR